jgi:hypothetical protein
MGVWHLCLALLNSLLIEFVAVCTDGVSSSLCVPGGVPAYRFLHVLGYSAHR